MCAVLPGDFGESFPGETPACGNRRLRRKSFHSIAFNGNKLQATQIDVYQQNKGIT